MLFHIYTHVSQADDVAKLLAEKLQPGFLTNLDTFVASLSKESKFVPYGELINSFKTGRGKVHSLFLQTELKSSKE